MEKIGSSNTHEPELFNERKGYPRTTSSGGIHMYTPVCTDVKSQLLEDLIFKSARLSLELLTTDEGEGASTCQIGKLFEILEVICVFRKWYLADSGTTRHYECNTTDARTC